MMHMLGKLENDQVNTLKKKLGRGSPINNEFSFTPSPFPSQHKVCVCVGGGGGETEVGGVLALLWTTETCTKVQLQVW